MILWLLLAIAPESPELTTKDLAGKDWQLHWVDNIDGRFVFYPDGTYYQLLYAPSGGKSVYQGTWTLHDNQLITEETSDGKTWSTYTYHLTVDRKTWPRDHGITATINKNKTRPIRLSHPKIIKE